MSAYQPSRAVLRALVKLARDVATMEGFDDCGGGYTCNRDVCSAQVCARKLVARMVRAKAKRRAGK